MKKTILKNGLIAGAIVTIMMVIASTMMYNDPNFQGSMVLGFAGMLIAFSFIFIGIKNFRDKQNGGTVTFWKAFKIGFFIALVASSCYVGVWMIEHHFFFPDFMDKYSALEIRHINESGATAAEIKEKIAEIEHMKVLYKNPFIRILYTYFEIFPLGIIVALISALILKKKTV
jgi:hypothetical protein